MKNQLLFRTKLILTFSCFFMLISFSFSQGVIIKENDNKDRSELHPSAIMDVRSTEKGVLIPSMTTVDRELIASPANGLLVFDTNENCFYFWDNSAKEGLGGWIKKMSGDVVVSTGEAGRVAYFQDVNTLSPSSFIEIADPATKLEEDPIFLVRNNEGQIVFAVYESGVKVWVDDRPEKSARGTFAVGGFTTQKEKTIHDYLRISPDSVRFNILDSGAKSARGTFAVGGFTTTKGTQDLLLLSQDSVRFYIDDTPGKSARGSFAVGGFTTHKTGIPQNHFFNVEVGDEQQLVSPSRPHILWHPGRNAFLAGQVLIENSLDVGYNSLSIGYETKASGNRSQALGFESQALGDNSTAIGKNALAQDLNSFAFGDGAKSLNNDAYAFGTNAEALGEGSFAFGSMGRDSVNVEEMNPSDFPTRAQGNYSFAFGLGSLAASEGAFALGTNVNAAGPYSVAMGYNTQTQGFGAASVGWGSMAEGSFSTAAGFYSIALGEYSISKGFQTMAEGMGSIAMGNQTFAKSAYETALGSFNDNQGYFPNAHNWVPNDRLFVIGNGYEGMHSNALTILKNGMIGLQDVYMPAYSLQLPNNIENDGYGNGMATQWLTYSDKRIKSNIKELSYGLSEILKLYPVEYFHHNSKVIEKSLKIDESGANTMGLIAQKVYEIIPEAVLKPQNEDTELWGMSYDKLVPVLIKAIQEQQSQINEQSRIIKEFENRLEKLEAENNQ